MQGFFGGITVKVLKSSSVALRSDKSTAITKGRNLRTFYFLKKVTIPTELVCMRVYTEMETYL